MDPKERIGDYRDSIQAALDSRQGQMWTALPALINAIRFNDAKKGMTVDVQPTIMGKQASPPGSDGFDQGLYTDIALPILLDCPIVFPSGGGFTLTFPIAVGDECLVIFASRCIDGWWQQGKVQPQAEFRMHDLSDGFVLVGPKSLPSVIKNLSTTKVQLRTDDVTSGAPNVYLEIDKAAQQLTIFTQQKTVVNATGDCDINSMNGAVNVVSHGKTIVTSGDNTEVNATGDVKITASGNVNVTAAQINLNA